VLLISFYDYLDGNLMCADAAAESTLFQITGIFERKKKQYVIKLAVTCTTNAAVAYTALAGYPETRNETTATTRQHIHSTMKKLLGAMFSVRSVPRLYDEK
jgi:hypothetical protein